MKAVLPVFATLALGACVPTTEVARLESNPGAAQPLEIYRPGPVNPLPPGRSNQEMVRDFLELGFAMESGRPIAAFSRFEGPVIVTTRGVAPATAIPDLDRLIGRLRAEAGIDIARAATAPEGANTITVVRVEAVMARPTSRVPRTAAATGR